MHSMPQGRLVAAGLLALVLCSPCLAENDDNTWEFGGFFGFVRFDPDTDINSTFAPSVLVGYNFTKRHGGEFSYSTVSSSGDRGPAVDVDVDIVRFGYTFNAYPKEKRVAFFTAGIGNVSTDPGEAEEVVERLEDSDDNLFVYTGGGYRWFINRKWGVRLHGTLDFVEGSEGGLEHYEINGTASVGIVYIFGTRDVQPPAEPPAEEPAEEPAEPPAPSDNE